eukprot:TRINITY_DN2035_c0_g1_i1.p1 TRINITY_DN2035_c0_g1~~TRINITY_DN2035_c0_g1_i1.p1  ORF type:complete len:636 (+),score=171.89 TRINITY_DN2035_c0_g1_i1:96-2003(+)
MANNTYKVEYAKTGRSTCKWKECKQTINAQEARVGKCFPSFFSDGLQVDWYHPECAFKAMGGMKINSVVAETEDQMEGLDSLQDDDRTKIVELIHALHAQREAKRNGTAKKTATPKKAKAAAAAAPALGASKPIQPAAQKALVHGTTIEKKPAPVHTPAASSSSSSKSSTAPSHSVASTSAAPKKTVAFTTTSHQEDPLAISGILPDPWLSLLLPVLNNMDAIETKLGTEADGIVPVRDSIFEAFHDLHPEDVRVVAIGPGPIPVSTAAAGYALMDASATKWTEKLPVAVQRLFDALKAQAQNDGNTTYSVSAGWGQLSVRSWFEYTKKNGVLWLNSCLTRSIHTARSSGDELRERAYWLPVVLRVIRYLMEIRANGDAGIVFALFGAEGSPRYDDITTAISKYYARFSSKLLVRTYKAPDPSEAAFQMDEDSNPFAEINASLMETNNQPIEWFPPKPGQPAPSVAASSSSSSSSSTAAAVPKKPAAPAPKASSIFDDEADDSPMKPTLQKKRTAAEMSKPPASQPKSDDWESALAPKPKKAKTSIADDDDDWKPSSMVAAASASKPPLKKKKSKIEDDEYDSTDSFIAPEDDFGEEPDDDDDGDSRPLCRYGTACYRKNPDHFKQFRHPWKDGK